MAVWKFTDGVVPETYELEINPGEGGSPTFEKTLTTIATPAGPPIVFEGRDKPRVFEISGALTTESQYNAFESWYNKNYQIKVTDDLSREFWIFITNLTMTRAPLRSHPWRHTFRMSYTEVDW